MRRRFTTTAEAVLLDASGALVNHAAWINRVEQDCSTSGVELDERLDQLQRQVEDRTSELAAVHQRHAGLEKRHAQVEAAARLAGGN